MRCRDVMKKDFIRLIVGIVAFCGSGDATSSTVRGPLPETVEAWVIPNYHLLQPDLAIGGQPTASGLTWLPAIGFRIVVDLRAPSEGTAAEETALKAVGMRYLSVPITPESFRAADVDAVTRVLDEPGRGPVLMHCASGNSAAGVWTVLQVKKGRPYAEAEAEGRKVGLQSPAMIAAVRRLAGQESETH